MTRNYIDKLFWSPTLGFWLSFLPNPQTKLLVDNQNDLVEQFSHHELQWMVGVEKFYPSKTKNQQTKKHKLRTLVTSQNIVLLKTPLSKNHVFK